MAETKRADELVAGEDYIEWGSERALVRATTRPKEGETYVYVGMMSGSDSRTVSSDTEFVLLGKRKGH